MQLCKDIGSILLKKKLESEMIGVPDLKQGSVDLAADRLNKAFDEYPYFKCFPGSEEYDYKKS
jgi:hypothetical protein